MQQYWKTLLPLLLLWSVLPVSGQVTRQNCGLTLSGQVTDHDTREPLIGATIFIPELQEGAVTDAFGNYHFHGVCEGTYTLTCAYIGYEALKTEIKMRNSVVYHFKPHPNAEQLKQVQITAHHIPVVTSQAVETLEGRELQQTAGQSIGEALKRISGLSSIQTGPTISKPVIHGMYGNRVLMLNNGVRQEGQQWGSEHAPEIDPFTAGKMIVVKGAAGVRYGSDAIGGVVLVEPNPLPDSVGIGGALQLVGSTNNRQGNASGMLEGKLAAAPAFSWRLQGTLKRAGNVKAPDYYLKNTGFSEQDFSATVGYKRKKLTSELFYSEFRTRLGIYSVAHFGNLTDLNQAIALGEPPASERTGFTYKIDRPYQQVLHRLMKWKTDFETENSGDFHFTYGLQYNERDEFDKHVTRGSGDRPELHLELTTHTTELIWDHQPVNNFSGTVGISSIYQQNTYAGRFFIPDYNSFSAGAFALEKWQLKKVLLEAGVRYDYKNLRDIFRGNVGELAPDYTFHNFSGTGGLIYDAGYHLTFSANVGTAWRAPNASELFSDGVHHGTATYEKGNKELEAENAFNTSVTVAYHSNRRLNGEITVYQNYIRNYIFLEPQPEPVLTIRGAFPFFAYRQVNAVFRGLDLNATYAFTEKLSWESKATLVRAYNFAINDYLFLTPSDRFINTIRYEAGNYFRKAGLENTFFAFGSTLVRRQNRVPANTDFSAAPAGYFLLQAELGTTFRIGQQPVEFGISGQNLLNTTYRDYLNRFRYFADEMGRNITFRLRIPLDFPKR